MISESVRQYEIHFLWLDLKLNEDSNGKHPKPKPENGFQLLAIYMNT